MSEQLKKRIAYVDTVVAKGRARWQHLVEDGVLTEEQFEEALCDAQETLLVHPVGMELVARAMPRVAPQETTDRSLTPYGRLDRVVGEGDD